jgi:hypothetical protein
MANNSPQHVVTGKVRLSFVHLFSPYANPNGGDPKYSTTILLPKSDIATKQAIDAAINAAIQQGVAKTWNGVRPPIIAIPVYDGDGVRPSDGMPFGEECKGNWVFTASSKQQPQVVDAAIQPILNQSEIYSGIYARVSIQFFPYANSGKKGIGCGLGNVQKLDDGEPLGGRTNAADDFGGGAGYTPPAYPQQPAQPVYQQPPVQPVYPQTAQNYSTPGQIPYPQQTYPQQPVQPVQIDPITGQPIMPGGVMGL